MQKREIIRTKQGNGMSSTKLLIAHDGGMCWVSRIVWASGKTAYRVLWGAKKAGQRDEDSTVYRVGSFVSLKQALLFKNEAMTVLNMGGTLAVRETIDTAAGLMHVLDTQHFVDAEYYPDDDSNEDEWQRVYGYGAPYVATRKVLRDTAAMQKQLEGLDEDCSECMNIRFMIEDSENPHEDYSGLFYQVGTNGHFFGCPIGGG